MKSVFKPGLVATQPPGQFAASHLGHDDVGQQHVVARASGELDRFARGCCRDHLVAVELECLLRQVTDLRFVFGEQDCLVAPRRRGGDLLVAVLELTVDG